MAEVSTFKGQFVANIFSLLFAAGRACLMPFLTIYFYYLGLSPIQTGLLLGLKSFTSVWSAVCWTKYVRTPKRKRCVLVFSIVVLMLTHMAMMLMPALDSAKNSSFCPKVKNQTSTVPCTNSSVDGAGCQYNTTSVGLSSVTEPATTDHSDTEVDEVTTASFSLVPSVSTTVKSTEIHTKPANLTTHRAVKPGHVPVTSEPKNSQLPAATEHIPSAISASPELPPASGVGVAPSELATTLPGKTRSLNPKHRVHPDKFTDGDDNSEPSLPDDDDDDKTETKHTKDKIERNHQPKPEKREAGDSRQASTVSNDLAASASTEISVGGHGSEGDSDNVGLLMKSLDSIHHQVFVALLVLVLVGEMFSSPTEQLTSDLWLRFLDSFEKLEKSHIPKLWASFGAALTPWAICLLIDYLPCVLPYFRLPRILVHFFSFEVVISLALLLSFCYPVIESDGSKTKKWSRFVRGLRAVCGDALSFICMFTVVVLGFVYGFINTFLFWVMHEISDDGSELPMGLALTAAAAGEFLMSFFVGCIVRKLKCPISVIVGLSVLCLRCVLYSFLFNPWIAIVGEAGHMLSHTFIWGAVQNHPTFRVNPLIMDTSAQNALGLVYSGFGISSGCLLSGLCYSWFGSRVMFQIAASVAGVWCLIFTIVFKCCSRLRKQRVRYTKIAQEEMADSDVSDDDWLDTAVKRKN